MQLRVSARCALHQLVLPPLVADPTGGGVAARGRIVAGSSGVGLRQGDRSRAVARRALATADCSQVDTQPVCQLAAAIAQSPYGETQEPRIVALSSRRTSWTPGRSPSKLPKPRRSYA